MPGRKTKNQEFLLTLKRVTDSNNRRLGKLTGKKEANVSAYLGGAKPVGDSVLRSAMKHLSEWGVAEDQTMLPVEKKGNIGAHPGIYLIYDSAGNCVYIGQASNLKTEVNLRLRSKKLRHGIWRSNPLRRKRHTIEEVAAFVSTFRVDSPRLRHNLEALLLRAVINQTQNSKLGRFR